MNQKLTLFICLLGLAIVANLAVDAQEEPAPSADKPALPSAQPDIGEEGMEEDEDFMPDELAEDEEYEDEYENGGEEEYEDEEPMSSEEQLSDLLEAHFAVKRDCRDLKNMVAEAKQTNQTADPQVQQAYEGCMQELQEIETEMKVLTEEIFSNEESES